MRGQCSRGAQIWGCADQPELNLECSSSQCMVLLEGIDAHVKILLRKAIAFLSSPNCCPGVLQAQKSEA